MRKDLMDSECRGNTILVGERVREFNFALAHLVLVILARRQSCCTIRPFEGLLDLAQHKKRNLFD